MVSLNGDTRQEPGRGLHTSAWLPGSWHLPDLSRCSSMHCHRRLKSRFCDEKALEHFSKKKKKLYHSSKRQKPHDPLSRCKNTLDKIQHPFMIETLTKVGIGRIYLNTIKRQQTQSPYNTQQGKAEPFC